MHWCTVPVMRTSTGPVFWGNLAGLALMGLAGISLCMFISAQTESQIIAAIGGFAGMLVVISLNSLAAVVPFEPLQKLLYGLSFYDRYYNLTMGIFQLSDLVFFFQLCGTVFLLDRPRPGETQVERTVAGKEKRHGQNEETMEIRSMGQSSSPILGNCPG